MNLIVAMCRDRGIGFMGKLPWHIPQELQHFAKLTKGDGLNAVVMGHNTWQTLPILKGKARGLPDRDNFVLSRSSTFDMLINHDRLIKTFPSLAELDTYIETNATYEEVWVIGGADVYKQFLAAKKIDYCYVSYIDEDFECDTFFPELDSKEWKEIESLDSYDKNYECNIRYVVYKKIDQDILL